MKIIELTKENDFGYKTFFLKGLTQHPDFFRISVQDEINASFPTQGTEDSFTLGMISEVGDLLGVVSFQREGETREKLRHKGLLFRMYVSAESVGKGIGKKLIEELIIRARKIGNIEQINLTVASTNLRAKELYTRLGFQTFSVEKNAIKYQNQYFSEDSMVLFINA